MRILIVDDSEDGCEIIEAMLVSAGYEQVSTADSASRAYDFLGMGEGRPTTVDLILLDIMMPGIDGIEACARIRGDQRYSCVPIIMVTSLADTDSLANAFVAGATDYITKPVNRVELLARVRSALKLKAELDRRKARELELIQLTSRSGSRRPMNWIDGNTGLFKGEMAEAYLAADANFPSGSDTSVIALAIDRLDNAGVGVLAQVAEAVRSTTAAVGVVAAIYRDGVIVLVLPEQRCGPARKLGEAIRASISDLRIANPESIAANQATASVAVVTGRAEGGARRIQLLTRAISALSEMAAAGGDHVVAECV